MRRTDDKINASIEYNNSICVNSCHVIQFIDPNQYSYEYLLGLLNSKLIQKIFALMNPQMIKKVFAEIKVIYVERFPIWKLDFTSQKEKAT